MHRDVERVLRLIGLLEPARRAELRWRLGQDRALPDAVILGAQKCGTSSLHYYLVQHPQVIAPGDRRASSSQRGVSVSYSIA